jgi:hypothetical protein
MLRARARVRDPRCTAMSVSGRRSTSGGARKRSCKAVKRSTRSIGPLHRGHSQATRALGSTPDFFSFRIGSARINGSAAVPRKEVR